MKPGQSVAPSANMRNVNRGETGRRGPADAREQHLEVWVLVSVEETNVRGGDRC